MKHNLERNLTTGGIAPCLISFSLPLIAGNILQQFYNITDTLIVGKTLGAAALAAVGSSFALMVLVTSIILGLCMGSGVVFSQFYGAKQYEDLKIALGNAFVFIAMASVFINVLSFLLLENVIVWLCIPPEAVSHTREYLTVILAGMSFVSIYNFFSAVLRSVGNTVIPLVFLAVSAVTNIILDLLFILVLQRGVRGAAEATVIAQALSAICIMLYFFIVEKDMRPSRCHFALRVRHLSLIMSNSTLSALQQSIMNFGILMVQGLVNSFGFAASAAFAVVVKIDAFAYLPAQDFGNAFATFVAQNYGARQNERIHQGIKTAVKITALFCLFSSAIVWIFAKPLSLLFIKAHETEIIRLCIDYLRIEGAFYCGIGILFLFYALYRGLGKPQIAIALSVISLGSRVLLAYTLSAIPAVGITGVWWSVPIGWALADTVGLLYYRARKDKLLSAEKYKKRNSE